MLKNSLPSRIASPQTVDSRRRWFPSLGRAHLDTTASPGTDSGTQRSAELLGHGKPSLVAKAGCLLLAVTIAGLSTNFGPAVAASKRSRSAAGPSIPLSLPGAAKPVRTVTSKLKGHSVKVFIRTPRFGGRVQRDSLDRWIVDGSVIGLETVNIGAGQDAIFDTTLPVGLSPIELRGRYVLPAKQVHSLLEVGVSGEVPLQVSSTGNRSFAVPTIIGTSSVTLRSTSSASSSSALASSSDVSNSPKEYVEFTARSKVAGSCLAFAPSQLDRLQIVAGGTPTAPSMLADFFPLFLDRLIVRIDATSSAVLGDGISAGSAGARAFASTGSAAKAIDPDVAQTVLRLTTFAVKRWPAARVVVTDKAIAMTPYDRQVAIRVGAHGSVSLENLGGQSALVLSSSKRHLPALAEYLASPALEITFAKTVRTEGKSAATPSLEHVLTIGDLRGRSLTAKGYGSVDQAVTVTQSQLGGQTKSIAVKITGVAQVAGAGRLVVQLRANDQVLATKRVLNDEPFALKGIISRSALARDNVIVVRASELSSGTVAADELALAQKNSDDPANCGKGRPEVTVQLDSGSQFSATMGRGLPAGFDRFPQAFVNGFDVRFTRLQLGELQAAADVVQLLQGMSAPRLTSKVFAPNRSHTITRPMLYVGPPTKELTELDAPIIPDARVAKGEQPISVLQGFAATGDDHLVLVTNGSSASLSSLLAKLKADLRGWRSLRGDVMVKQNGRIRNIRVRASLGVGEEKDRANHDSRTGEAMRFGVGLGMALALFGALLARLFGRSRHS
jgi:hypothetical protein